jgi:uncharacterized damage-inducible protein DinB
MMARFNRWVNAKIYDCVQQMPPQNYREDCGLFWGSVHHTLNHLLVIDRLWTGRVAGVDHGIRSLDQMLFEDFEALRAARDEKDSDMIRLVDSLPDERLQEHITYWIASRKRQMQARIWDALTSMFNHQTHHRGQISAVLTQQGMEMPDIDLIYYLSETGAAKFVD